MDNSYQTKHCLHLQMLFYETADCEVGIQQAYENLKSGLKTVLRKWCFEFKKY